MWHAPQRGSSLGERKCFECSRTHTQGWHEGHWWGVGKLPTPDLRSDEESFSKPAEIMSFHNLNTCFVIITRKKRDWEKMKKKKNEKSAL